MAQKIGVLGISYGVRAVAMMDAIANSPGYDATIHVYDKQKNPFNYRLAQDTGGEHTVGDLKDVDAIVDFAKTLPKGKVDFAVVGPEDPIIAGVKDRLEQETGIITLCPSQEYAVEESKILQRELIAKACPDANPEYALFTRKHYGGLDETDTKNGFLEWYRNLNGMVAIKPDKPGHGAGVVVAGDHFDPENEEEPFKLFMKNLDGGDVMVEEALNLEEFSGQYLSDGNMLVEAPYTRDFKRRLDGDKGLNTGGMATLKGVGDILPFMTQDDRDLALDYANKIFSYLKGGETRNPGLLGVPMYIAYAITDKGLKILEINSRFGDPEGPIVVPLSEMPFAEVCMRMREGDLIPFSFDQRAGLLLYKVPPNYGGVDAAFDDRMVDLSRAERAAREMAGSEGKQSLLIYPGSMEIGDDGMNYALSSRTVASIGYGDSIEEAAEISSSGITSIDDGGLAYRNDPFDMDYWKGVMKHADELRAKAASR